MRRFHSRRVTIAFLTSVVAVGSLLAPEPAPAAKALFRVERKFYGAPTPPVTSPGGAGVYENYIQPYVLSHSYSPPATAIVEPGNPIGGAFTLPTGFIDVLRAYGSVTPRTPIPGYTTFGTWDYYNGPGRFAPSNGRASTTRIVFPTTLGNPTPNLGVGNPVTPTSTFSGRYDFSRAGSIRVTPGPRRFGGTMQIFHGPGAFWYQYIYYFAPYYYKAYGSFVCQDPPGVTCTSGVVSSIGDITSTGMMTRFLLNVPGTGTGKQTRKNTAKATTPIDPTHGTFPTQYGNASYVAQKLYYLHTIHPWTTGFAAAHNPLETPTPITPQLQDYDISLGGADITVTHTYTWRTFNSTLSTVTYRSSTYKQYMQGVGRVVSLVRPRLKHVYQKPLDATTDPIISKFQGAELWTMKVFFVPEAAGLVLLGAGLAILLGLTRMRRR